MKHSPKKLLSIFLTMLKIGAFTFGGGYAMISLLENEFVSKKKWLSKDEFMDMIAISESTPGPIAINSATYIGYRSAGFLGSLFATLGVVIPSFVIIFLISLFFDLFLSYEYVAYAFRGIQVCVVFLIFSAGIKFLRQMKINIFNIAVFSAVFITMILFSLFAVGFSSVYLILLSGVTGVFVYAIFGIRSADRGEK